MQKALEAQKTSDGSAIAGFAQADSSGNAFSLGLGGIVADSISSSLASQMVVRLSSTSLVTMLMHI